MRQQLKDRLRQIKTKSYINSLPEEKKQDNTDNFTLPDGFSSDWEIVGFKTLRRIINVEHKSFENPDFFIRAEGLLIPALAIIVPDLFNYGRNVNAVDLVFFDLETTGLSTGAGTISFLAAFGRFIGVDLEVTQYLLLDFPGENDYIQNLLDNEFSRPGASGAAPLIVSYNGKTFDSQIIRTRCLLNGFTPPEYYHADLLHPCRRLWKGILPSCSQASIETNLLGIDRSDDIPGSMAPDIWFSFLKTGNTRELMGICDHNLRDISGLAKIFLMLGDIARDPIQSQKKYNYDIDALAFRWRDILYRRPGYFTGDESLTAAALFSAAAEELGPRALRQLAIEAEWHKGDIKQALEYTQKILDKNNISINLKEETLRRFNRLNRKAKS
jgi:uncharacterized protein YprB with RNaseH-like and TPR domain